MLGYEYKARKNAKIIIIKDIGYIDFLNLKLIIKLNNKFTK